MVGGGGCWWVVVGGGGERGGARHSGREYTAIDMCFSRRWRWRVGGCDDDYRRRRSARVMMESQSRRTLRTG